MKLRIEFDVEVDIKREDLEPHLGRLRRIIEVGSGPTLKVQVSSHFLGDEADIKAVRVLEV